MRRELYNKNTKEIEGEKGSRYLLSSVVNHPTTSTDASTHAQETQGMRRTQDAHAGDAEETQGKGEDRRSSAGLSSASYTNVCSSWYARRERETKREMRRSDNNEM